MKSINTHLDNSVEAINVPLLSFGDLSLVFLRSRKMPNFAFLMREKDPVTRSQMVFRNDPDHKKYLVVCPCCLFVEECKDETQEIRRLREEVAGICWDLGVRVLFVRKAHEWNKLGSIKGLILVEASEHKTLLKSFYASDEVEEALHFIDYKRSRGLE